MRLYLLISALLLALTGCSVDYSAQDLDGDGYTVLDGDCDEGDGSAYPGADETWYDDVDQDCGGDSDWDADGDGEDSVEGGGGDCDDTNPLINTSAIETCDGSADEDCDGLVDEDDAEGASTWYADGDGDGYGTEDDTALGCDAPTGYVPDASDCDDTREDVNNYAEETCDDADQDCDGVVDEDPTDAPAWYADVDGDGFGDPENATATCDVPDGYVEDNTDCDDSSTAFYPGAPEEDCTDPSDYNCDGSTGYDDVDGDGTPACEDCDDDNADAFPGAAEDCDTDFDDDCDGDTNDINAANCDDFYFDDDGDGYGAGASTVCYCEAFSGIAADASDCDDADASVNPAGTEACDGSVDEDCDGAVDEDDATGVITWYADADGDGYRDESSTDIDCDQPSGYLPDTAGSDCDDTRDDVNPAASEYCDGSADEDCDGTVDEDGAADATTWYADSDSDSFGDAGTTDVECYVPTGYVSDDTDCDDASADHYPGATEYCDGDDDDCDDDIDEDGAADAFTWYADDDADTYGDAADSDVECYQPAGYVLDDTDCDDTRADVNTAASEYCDGSADEDCDGAVDEDGAADVLTWYADTDSDSFGDPDNTDVDCEQPAGYVADDTDCDDGASTTYPGATEYCDGIDTDCDSDVDEDGASDAPTWYADADSDSYGDPGTSDVECYQPTGYVSDDTDCDDGAAATYPGADEYCDGTDTDCDGTLDEDDALDALTFYADTDSDGYGDAGNTYDACEVPGGYVSDDTDCDDGAAATYPGADEYCDGTDTDCDGTLDEDDALDVLTWYADTDSDDYGDAGITDIDCAQPAGYVGDDTDCDDARSDVNPGADEVCDDATDEDCDSTIDEDGAVDALTWYADADVDAYGDPGVSDVACDQPAGYVSDDTDCDDGDALSNPGATEICDGSADEDCDTLIDEGAAEVDDLYDNDCDEYVDEDFVSAGDVIINEVMIDPKASDATGEWFELWNVSARDVRMDGWEISGTDVSSDVSFYIPPGLALTVGAGEYLLFCRDTTGPGTTGLACDYVYRNDQGYTDSTYGPHHALQIFNTTDGDTLAVTLGSDLIDEFTYSEGFVPGVGYSAELSVNHADATSNDTESNWCVADSTDNYNGNYGTPRGVNTCAL